MEAVDEELKEIFADEAGDLLDAMEAGLLELELHPDDSASINEVFRATHTLKGNALLLEMDQVAKFAHAMEDVLDKVREGELALGSDLNSVLLSSRDALAEMIADSVQGRNQAHAQAEELRGQLASFMKNGGPPEAADAPAKAPEPPQAAAAKTDQASQAGQANENGCQEPDLGAASFGGRILLIHDVGVIRQLVTRYLSMTELGEAQVDVAATSAEGLEMLNQERYDTVLCGLEIAGMDGLAVHAHMLATEWNRETPFIIITSSDTPENRNRLEENGIEHFIIAPFSPTELKKKVGETFSPQRRRNAPRFAVGETKAVIDLGSVKVSGRVVNLSLEGMLCHLTDPGLDANLLQSSRIALEFPAKYGVDPIKGIQARPVKVYILSWNDNDQPGEVRAAWTFQSPAPEIIADLKKVLSQAHKEFLAAHRNNSG